MNFFFVCLDIIGYPSIININGYPIIQKKEGINMVGRPPKEDSRNKQYRVRLNDTEDDMLSFCSNETGEAKSEIFRKALKAYYENTKYCKNILIRQEDEFDEENGVKEYDMDHISLKRSIQCPYCGFENNMDFADDCDSWSEERQMGPQITYEFNWNDCECERCGKSFEISGSIWEYPVGAYNYEEIYVKKTEEDSKKLCN